MKTQATPANLRRVLLSCLHEGGAILKKGFGTSFKIHMKGPVNPVTDIDLAAEKKIFSILRKYFPDHGILSEESAPKIGSSEYRWIIDPLDGTINFAHGLPMSAVSIGLEKSGRMIIGGIYNPMIGELFLTEKGKGATLNGRRIRVSSQTQLIKSLLVTGFPYDRQSMGDYYLKFVGAMLKNCAGIRRLGSAALDLAYVSCGRFEAFWEFNLQPWDVAAGMLMVAEAGGKVSDFYGKSIAVDSPVQVLASNGRIHSKILEKFIPHLKK